MRFVLMLAFIIARLMIALRGCGLEAIFTYSFCSRSAGQMRILKLEKLASFSSCQLLSCFMGEIFKFPCLLLSSLPQIRLCFFQVISYVVTAVGKVDKFLPG